MKKFLVLALSALLVFAIAGTSFAAHLALETSGDGRIRGLWKGNFDANDNTDDDARYWDQRVRLRWDVNITEGIWVRTRLRVSDGKWSGTANTKVYKKTDFAYIQFPLAGGTLYYGYQPASWGNGFWSWGKFADRAKFIYKTGDTMWGAIVQKNVELGAGDNSGDNDSYMGLVIQNIGKAQWGAIVVVTNDDTADTTNISVDGYFKKIAVGNMMLKGEFAYNALDNVDDDPFGAMIQADLGMDAMTLTGIFAVAVNGFKADDDFEPTELVGKDQAWAHHDFGAYQTVADDSAMLLAANVSFKASDTLSYGASLAYNLMSSDADSSMIDVGATVKYKIGAQTTFVAGLGYGLPSDFGNDDPISTLYHAVSFKF